MTAWPTPSSLRTPPHPLSGRLCLPLTPPLRELRDLRGSFMACSAPWVESRLCHLLGPLPALVCSPVNSGQMALARITAVTHTAQLYALSEQQ